jgi:hypothetical protein
MTVASAGEEHDGSDSEHSSSGSDASN